MDMDHPQQDQPWADNSLQDSPDPHQELGLQGQLSLSNHTPTSFSHLGTPSPSLPSSPSSPLPRTDTDIPAIDAIFVVRFDTLRGNVVDWHDSTRGLQIDGLEYAALPSGLHNVLQDVIYFQLEGCVGVAAYANVPSDEPGNRGAMMVSVGVLVKPSSETGRCGQVWRHVEFLKQQAQLHAPKQHGTLALQAYFSRHRTTSPLPGSSVSNKRDSYRAMNLRRISRSFTLSEPIQSYQGINAGPLHQHDADEIPISHPSNHFLELVQSMGPLIFILWRAALLKKRILIYTPPPIEPACLAVYNICLMATIPLESTPIAMLKSSERLQPLFCIGVQNIDSIQNAQGGFVGCTTDQLFLSKPHLFDMLVELPNRSVTSALGKPPSPRIRTVDSTSTSLTLRDVGPHAKDRWRYFHLMQQQSRYRRKQDWLQKHTCVSAHAAGGDDTSDHQESTLYSTPEDDNLTTGSGFNMSDTLRKMLTGGWWWWYGDEGQESEFEPLMGEENVQDSAAVSAADRHGMSGACLQVLQSQNHGNLDTEAIRFFHHLTRALLVDLGRLLSFKATSAIFEEGEEGEQRIEILRRDVRELGLDGTEDGAFVTGLSLRYFETEVYVQESLLAPLRMLCCQGCFE